MMISTATVRGVVTIHEVNLCTGLSRVVERGSNLVTTAGVRLIIQRLMSTGGGPLTKFGLGTGSTAAALTDTALQAQVSTLQPISRLTDATPTLTAQLHITSTQYNGVTIREAGLFDDTSTLFARYVLATPYAKTNELAVTFTWDITFMPA